MKLPYIKNINLTKNYTYLTDKLMGIKIIGVDIDKLIDDSTVYKVAWIGKSKPGDLSSINSGSYFATNKIVRNVNVPIHAFTNDKHHTSIYITDLFMVTRKSSNIYDKNRAFFSAIIDTKDENNINHKYNYLLKSLNNYLPF